MIALTGSRSQIVERELPADDPTQRCPDISVAKQVLEWQPHMPLEAGLLKTVAYFRDHLRRDLGEAPPKAA